MHVRARRFILSSVTDSTKHWQSKAAWIYLFQMINTNHLNLINDLFVTISFYVRSVYTVLVVVRVYYTYSSKKEEV